MLTYADICARLEREEPALWRECNPRIYQAANRYGAPRVAAAMAAVAITWVRADYRNAPATTRNIYLGACVQRRYQFPALFLAPDLAAAIAATEPPPDLLWQEMPLPFEGGALCLPLGTLRHPDGAAADVICWARVRAGERVEWPGAPAVQLAEDVFITWTGLPSQPGLPLLDSVLNASTSPHVGDSHVLPGRDGVYSLPLAPSEGEFLRQCRALVFSALLALDARPQLLTEGRRIASGKRGRREIWIPSVIGAAYRIAREPGEAETRRVWIDPVLVGKEGQ